jgi:hypothetical protein
MADLSPQQVDELAADISPAGMRAHGAKKVPEFVNYLKQQGLSDDEVEATFIKNFGTPTYNADQTANIADLKKISPQAIKQRGVRRATGYEQIFFSPEERRAAGVEEPAPQVPAPTQPVEMAPEATVTQQAAQPVPEEGPSIQAAEGTFPEEPWYKKVARGLLPQGLEEKYLGQAPYDKEQYQRDLAKFKSGPVPEFSLKQVGRPLGFAAGAATEAAKLGIAGGAAVTAGLTGQTTGDVLRESEKFIGAEPGYLTPKTKESIATFAKDAERRVPKAVVDNAIEEGADLIEGLATMLIRDVIPVLPGPERNFEEYLKTGFESGQQFAAGFPVMATFGLEVVNQLGQGNIKEATNLMAAKPVTLALILLPYIKKGAIQVSPAARAWVERTAGKYYAEQTPESRAAQEVKAAGERTYLEPTKQATPAETRQVESALAEARSAQSAAREALQEGLQARPTRSGFVESTAPVVIEPESRFSPSQVDRDFGVTEAEVIKRVKEGESPVPQTAIQSVRRTEGIPGEKAAFETGLPAGGYSSYINDVVTRQVRPTIKYTYDFKNNRVVSEPLSEVSRAVSSDIETTLELEQIAEDLRTQGKRADAINRFRQLSGDTTTPNSEIAKVVNTLSSLQKAKSSGGLVATEEIPPNIASVVDTIKRALLDKLVKQRVVEGVGDAKLSSDIADQVGAVALDIVAENESVLLRNPKVREVVAERLAAQPELQGTANPKQILQLLDKVAEDANLRVPEATLQIGDVTIEPDVLTRTVGDVFNKMADNPKVRMAIGEQIRQQVTKSVEQLVFNKSLSKSAENMTETIPVEPRASEGFVNKVIANIGRNTPQASVIVTDPRIFETVVTDLLNSETPSIKAVGEQLARYEDAKPELVKAGIVPEGAKVSRGFNESFGSLVQGMRQFQAVDRIFGGYKRNLTSRNLLSGINNLTSNILLETMYYGNPDVILEVLNPKSEMRSFARRLVENKPTTVEEAAAIKAIRDTGIIDTSLLETELDMTESGLVTKAAGKVAKPLGNLSAKVEGLQDKFYKFGDSFFKIRTTLTEMNKAKSFLNALPTDGSLTINDGLGGQTVVTKVGEGQYAIKGQIVSPEQLDGLLARAGARIASNKFIDYGKRPLYLQNLEELRYGPFGGPLVTPFLTWAYKMTDAALPYVSTGRNVRPGAMAALPAKATGIMKGGIGSTFSDSIVADSSSAKVKGLIMYDAAQEAARRAAIFGAAENISQGQEEMIRKGLSFAGKNDPVLTYLNQQDPRIIYGKSFSQLNFFNPSLSALKGLNDVVMPAAGAALGLVSGQPSDSFLPKSYIERRAKGETFGVKDLAELAGYGGDSLYDFYKKIDTATNMGGLALATEVVHAGLPAVLGGTYGRAASLALDKMIDINQKKAGKYPVDSKTTAPLFEEVVRHMLGLGYKEAFLYGSLKSSKPTEVLDKVYKQYESNLYNNFVNSFIKEFTYAREQGASQEQLDAIRAKHKEAIDTFKRIVREVGENYKDIVNKAKQSKK